MGRRSISTTKSGKFMNPTDQASKTLSHSLIIILLASLILCLFVTFVYICSYAKLYSFHLNCVFFIDRKGSKKARIEEGLYRFVRLCTEARMVRIDVITSCTKIRLLSLYHSCIALFSGVYLCLKTCVVFSLLSSYYMYFPWLYCMRTFLYFYPQNKKQRKMVREAVLKSKDPRKILEEIEKIENMGK